MHNRGVMYRDRGQADVGTTENPGGHPLAVDHETLVLEQEETATRRVLAEAGVVEVIGGLPVHVMAMTHAMSEMDDLLEIASDMEAHGDKPIVLVEVERGQVTKLVLAMAVLS